MTNELARSIDCHVVAHSGPIWRGMGRRSYRRPEEPQGRRQERRHAGGPFQDDPGGAGQGPARRYRAGARRGILRVRPAQTGRGVLRGGGGIRSGVRRGHALADAGGVQGRARRGGWLRGDPCREMAKGRRPEEHVLGVLREPGQPPGQHPLPRRRHDRADDQECPGGQLLADQRNAVQHHAGHAG